MNHSEGMKGQRENTFIQQKKSHHGLGGHPVLPATPSTAFSHARVEVPRDLDIVRFNARSVPLQIRSR